MENQALVQAPPISPTPVPPPVKTKSPLSGKLFLAVIILLIFFLGGSGFLILNSRLNPQPPVAKTNPTSAPIPTPIDETSTWKTYNGNFCKISFKYPANWEELTTESQKGCIIEIKNPDLDKQYFVITKVGTSWTEILEKNKDGQETTIGGAESVITKPIVAPDGSFNGVYIHKNDVVYGITYAILEGQNDLQDIYNQILSTFKFTETNNPVACTEEAKICPDGSSVGRTGPKCEFTPCPQ
ncbi:MAG: hypothetical protein AAB675_04715 [Patescibacteria group bacterium]